jgi:hypothetical protein
LFALNNPLVQKESATMNLPTRRTPSGAPFKDRFQTMARDVHGYVTKPSMASLQKLESLLNRLSNDEVRKLELNYVHQIGSGPIERLNSRLLRDHLTQHFAASFKDKTAQLLKILEAKNPLNPKPATHVGGLTATQRQSGQAAAERLKGQATWPKGWPQPELLGQWLFRDSVWKALCSGGLGGGIGYTEHTISGAYTVWLFRVPDSDEIRKWESGGATAYLRQIAQNIDKQLTLFSKEIGWFMGGRGTVMAGDGVLTGLKAKIRSYQQAWENLGKTTQTLDVLQKKLLLPNSTFMKYLWSESTRNELRLWRESKVG